MLKNRIKQNGFTIIELLIVIAIIGILALLVLTNFQGAQARGRDTVRQTDINAMYQKLEEYFNNNGTYPTAGINSAAAQTTFPGIDPEALIDSDGVDVEVIYTDGASISTPDPSSSSTSEYILVIYGTGCTAGATDNSCNKYTIASYQETGDGDPPADYVRNSLN